MSCYVFEKSKDVFTLSVSEHICRPDESWCHMLRKHFSPGVVPQSGSP